MFARKHTPTYDQVNRIVARFGGVDALAKTIGRAPCTVFRWNSPRHLGGCDGLVPSPAVPLIQEAAELFGIQLTAEDWKP